MRPEFTSSAVDGVHDQFGPYLIRDRLQSVPRKDPFVVEIAPARVAFARNLKIERLCELSQPLDHRARHRTPRRFRANIQTKHSDNCVSQLEWLKKYRALRRLQDSHCR